MLAAIPNRQAMVDQYIRHTSSGEIFQIKYVGPMGVTAYRTEGFGTPASTATEPHEITWASLKHAHKFMVHVADIDVGSDMVQ